jgi:hypothetical protein
MLNDEVEEVIPAKNLVEDCQETVNPKREVCFVVFDLCSMKYDRR